MDVQEGYRPLLVTVKAKRRAPAARTAGAAKMPVRPRPAP